MVGNVLLLCAVVYQQEISFELKNDRFGWFFMVTANLSEDIHLPIRIEVEYQDPNNKKYYPLLFFGHKKQAKIINTHKFSAELYFSYKEHYALNYRTVVKSGKRIVSTRYLELYNADKLSKQILFSAKDIKIDLITLRNLGSEHDFEVVKGEVRRLSDKNEMRVDVSESKIESNGKHYIATLIEMLNSISLTDPASRQKYTRLADEYYKAMGFYKIDAVKMLELKTLIETATENNDRTQLRKLMFDLSISTPEFLHYKIKYISSIIADTESGNSLGVMLKDKFKFIDDLISFAD